MNCVHNDNVVIVFVTWHISAKFLFWGGGVVGGKRVNLYEVSKILFLRHSSSFWWTHSVNSPLRDNSIRRTPRSELFLGCLSSLLLVDSVLMRRTHSSGLKGVRVWESWVYLHECFLHSASPPQTGLTVSICVSCKCNARLKIIHLVFVKFYLRLSSDYGTFTKRSLSFTEILHQTTSCWEKTIKSP